MVNSKTHHWTPSDIRRPSIGPKRAEIGAVQGRWSRWCANGTFGRCLRVVPPMESRPNKNRPWSVEWCAWNWRRSAGAPSTHTAHRRRQEEGRHIHRTPEKKIVNKISIKMQCNQILRLMSCPIHFLLFFHLWNSPDAGKGLPPKPNIFFLKQAKKKQLLRSSNSKNFPTKG